MLDTPFGEVVSSSEDLTYELAIDADLVCHTFSATAEERKIKVTYKGNNTSREYKNRSEFWGRSRKTIGGKLADINSSREKKGLEPLTKDDFEVEDLQIAEPFENCAKAINIYIKGLRRKLGAKSYKCYLGKGECYRHEILMPKGRRYKGNRDGLIKPLLFKQAFDFLMDSHNGVLVEGRETDDYLTELSYNNFKEGKNDLIVVTRDKDALGNVGLLYNPDKMEEPLLIDESFGEIYLDGNNEVKGTGVKFQFAQILGQDDADNYKANKLPCGTSTKYGHTKVFKDLDECQNEKECWELCVRKFKEWIPEPVTYIAWNGEEETDAWITWLQKHVDFVVMERWEGYRWNVIDKFAEFEVDY
jgi:hypothetical protein